MRLSQLATVIIALTAAAGAIAQAPAVSSQNELHSAPWDVPRAVYTQTNAMEGNEVLIYRRDSMGGIELTGKVKTRGRGTGAGLGSQGAMVLTHDGLRLYVVNAGSDTISYFAVLRRGLTLIDRVPSGGDQPISLTLKHDLLYVLNAGSDSISGFRVAPDGRLKPLRDSSRPLSGTAVQPAQVLFNNTGDFLVVTEKATNKIDLYDVATDLARGPFVRNSQGMTPFGFAFDRRDRLVVSEAFGDAPGASATSSYDFDAADAPLDVISGSVKSGQSSACWVAITGNRRYAYVANTGSGTLTGYRIARNSALTLRDANGITASTGDGSKPQDLALSRKSVFLFALTPGTGTLHSFRVNADGSLTPVTKAQGVPASAQGLVAY